MEAGGGAMTHQAEGRPQAVVEIASYFGRRPRVDLGVTVTLNSWSSGQVLANDGEQCACADLIEQLRRRGSFAHLACIEKPPA
jgi:hypothetical protein